MLGILYIIININMSIEYDKCVFKDLIFAIVKKINI